MNILETMKSRQSIRKFKTDSVMDDDLNTILECAIEAPSAKNLQNWHFVVIKNKELILELSEIVIQKNKELSEYLEEDKKDKFLKFVKYATIFKEAPILILAYVGPYKITGIEEVISSGDNKTAEKMKLAAPGVHGVAAAMENLMLAANHLGYGTCWMTSQNYAMKEIEKRININKEGYTLMAVTPLGVPEFIGSKPSRKELKEVVTIIE